MTHRKVRSDAGSNASSAQRCHVLGSLIRTLQSLSPGVSGSGDVRSLQAVRADQVLLVQWSTDYLVRKAIHFQNFLYEL